MEVVLETLEMTKKFIKITGVSDSRLIGPGSYSESIDSGTSSRIYQQNFDGCFLKDVCSNFCLQNYTLNISPAASHPQFRASFSNSTQ